MNEACELAGFFAAHAVWSVSDGSQLIPMFASSGASGERTMKRLMARTLEEGVAQGEQMLSANEVGAKHAVLIYDGRITIAGEKLDALMLDIRNYDSPDSQVMFAVPYTPKKGWFGKFRVHRPKLLEWKNCDAFDQNAALETFFKGVDSHEKGAEVWNKCLDESK